MRLTFSVRLMLATMSERILNVNELCGVLGGRTGKNALIRKLPLSVICNA